jgi:hypothetical protein
MADQDDVATTRQALDPALQRILQQVPAPGPELLLCAACGTAITSVAARTVAGGSHEHHFTNPFGIRFHVGCFAAAPGCSVTGPPHHADTWFAGHVWRIATCGDCNTHLGWWFEHASRADVAGFHGLILPRLTPGVGG